jgi:membrane-associated phospholipid phosphatase
MRKVSIVCLMCVFLFYQGYSQDGSLSTVVGDTITKGSVSIIPKQGVEPKVVLNKKEQVYKLKLGVDIPIITVGTGWSLYAFTKIYNKPHPDTMQVQSLNSYNINALDRGMMYPYSKSMNDVSYYPFYAAMPLPLIFFLSDNEMRSDFFKLTFLYWEAMSVTGLLGTNATFHVDRYRPYAYFHDSHGTMDNEAPIGVVKNSFYAGHVQIVATPTFFLAKVYADYHPDSKIKWVFYGVASAATVSMAYMRIRAGEHFPSDVLLGAATGALAGILVPQFHKTKSTNPPAMGIMPYSTGAINGLVLTYNFKR